jgi:hypothetical protein
MGYFEEFNGNNRGLFIKTNPTLFSALQDRVDQEFRKINTAVE